MSTGTGATTITRLLFPDGFLVQTSCWWSLGRGVFFFSLVIVCGLRALALPRGARDNERKLRGEVFFFDSLQRQLSMFLLSVIMMASSLVVSPQRSQRRAQLLFASAAHSDSPRLRRFGLFRRQRLGRKSAAVTSGDTRLLHDGGDDAANGTLHVLVLSLPGARSHEDWMAVGCNETVVARWLQYELSAADQAELVELAEARTAEAAILKLLRRESLTLGVRATHMRLRQAWRASRLFLRGVRLSDLAYMGRLHAEAIAVTQPSRSQKLTERAFRRELVSHVHRTRKLRPSRDDARDLIHYVSVHSGLDMQRLHAPKGPTATLPLQDLAVWQELLTWFRDRFPYNRALCGCGAHGELLGNVRATAREGTFRAARTELQYCGACGAMTRFPRYNVVGKIVQTRQGRCGEYAQVLYQLVRALGWHTRLVVDWTDHLWVEALLPVGAPSSSSDAAAPKCRTSEAAVAQRRDCTHEGAWRWVMFDPCEAAVDLPGLYAGWGKNHTYIVAIGDARIVDVTATYARDMNETIARRDLSRDELKRALAWARLVSLPVS